MKNKGLVILVLLIISCKRAAKEEVPYLGWIKTFLPNHWIIYLPPGFVFKPERGVDSNPGLIISKKDTLTLKFDSGQEKIKMQDCDLHKSYLIAKASIDTGFYKEFYKVPVIHKAYIDTINGKIAIVILPQKTGQGTTAVEILPDCKSGYWLGINCTGLSREKQDLMIKIFKTISLDESKIR